MSVETCFFTVAVCFYSRRINENNQSRALRSLTFRYVRSGYLVEYYVSYVDVEKAIIFRSSFVCCFIRHVYVGAIEPKKS